MNQGRPAAGRLRAPGAQRRESQRGQVDQAAAIGRLERVPVALEPGRPVHPAHQLALHVAPPASGVGSAERVLLPAHHHRRDDVDVGAPAALGLELDRVRESGLVDARASTGRDHRLALEGLASVREHQRVFARPLAIGTLLGQRVLDLEQVGEVARGVDPDLQPDRLLVVVEDGQMLVEAVGDRARADHRELGIDVHGAGAGHEEEARLEVLEIVGGERVQALAVDGQHPLRQEPRVE